MLYFFVSELFQTGGKYVNLNDPVYNDERKKTKVPALTKLEYHHYCGTLNYSNKEGILMSEMDISVTLFYCNKSYSNNPLLVIV